MPGTFSLETFLAHGPADLELLLKDDGGIDVILNDKHDRRVSLWWNSEGFHGELWIDAEQIAVITSGIMEDLIGFVRDSQAR